MVEDRHLKPDYDRIMRQGCFQGIGLQKCRIPDGARIPNLGNKPFHIDSTFKRERPLCLECCSNTRGYFGFKESWTFKCDWRGADVKYDLFNKQFRFARRDTLTSLAVTSCEVKRPRERHIISVLPNEGMLVDPYWKFHLGVRVPQNPEEWRYTKEISATATAMKSDEYEMVGYIEYKEDGSLPCTEFVDCPGDSIESKLNVLYTSLMVQDDDAEKKEITVGGEEWKRPVEGLDALRGFKITRGTLSDAGAYTWTITWPQYQHEVPKFDILINGQNFTNATVKIDKQPDRYLHGYHLELGVEEKFSGLDYWRSASHCDIQIIEGDEPPDEFEEMWTMKFGDTDRYDIKASYENEVNAAGPGLGCIKWWRVLVAMVPAYMIVMIS